MHPLLRIENLTVEFGSEAGTIKAAKKVSFSAGRGEILAIVGESGSGKTVTALSILQLLPSPPANYQTGKILFSADGLQPEDLLKKSRDELKEIRGNKIAMIFQEPMTSLNPVFTCGKQVMEAILVHKKISTVQARTETIEWFTRAQLPDPEKIFARYPHQLSGGQKQRVMIAMAMSCHPSLLICDEPTTALDVSVQKTILDLIRQLQKEHGIGVIFITHDLGLVAEIADRVVAMYKGEIVEQNYVGEIFDRPQHPYTKALLACRPANHRKGERLPVVSDFMENDQSPSDQTGLNARKEPAWVLRQNEKKGVLLSVRNLSTWFAAKKNFLGTSVEFTRAVDDVSFDVYQGETLGLVGESGCGKTTLGRTLLRLIEPTGGKVIYRGQDLLEKSKRELKSMRGEIQIIFQDPYSSLNPRLTIGAALAEPVRVHHLFSERPQIKQRAIELLEKVGLRSEHFRRYPHEFSGGQRQRIVIARALAVSPAFIVCDEPVSALDVSVQAQVLNLLNDLKQEFNFTVIFISHDLSVVRYISDRIIVMNKGKIEESGTADDIYYHPKTEYTKKLISSIPGIHPVGK